MSKFQDLCALYAAWDDGQTENTMKLWRATFQLTQGWAKYINAPAIFGDRKTGEAIRYVDAMRHEHRHDGTNMPVQVKSYHAAVTQAVRWTLDAKAVRSEMGDSWWNGPDALKLLSRNGRDRTALFREPFQPLGGALDGGEGGTNRRSRPAALFRIGCGAAVGRGRASRPRSVPVAPSGAPPLPRVGQSRRAAAS